jgi:hypothetical protein
VRGPALFESLHVLGRRDPEPAERQDHGSDGDVGLRGFPQHARTAGNE